MLGILLHRALLEHEKSHRSETSDPETMGFIQNGVEQFTAVVYARNEDTAESIRQPRLSSCLCSCIPALEMM